MFKAIIKHQSDKSVLSFTSEIVLNYDKTRMYKLFFKNYKKKRSRIIKLINKYFKKSADKQQSNLRVMKRMDFNSIPISVKFFNKLKKLINNFSRLQHYNRKYDFFTIEELTRLVKYFFDWESCYEFPIKLESPKGQSQNSISLTFHKDVKFKVKK